jgi:hypothetical protein
MVATTERSIHEPNLLPNCVICCAASRMPRLGTAPARRHTRDWEVVIQAALEALTVEGEVLA